VKRTTFTKAERIAISELLQLAQCFAESTNEGVRMMAAVACERAADLIRGDAAPYSWPDDEIVKFAEFWNVAERARFNPREEPH
jgi:hypothetical protein